MDDHKMDDFEAQDLADLASDASLDEEETLNFRIKRSHFYAVMVPLFFLIGLAAGYLIWGQDQPAAISAEPITAGAEVAEAAEEVDPTEEAQSLAEEVAAQIPNLPRHEVTIGEDDPVLGPEDAVVTVVEFADFECPYCQRHFEQVYPELQAAYGDQIRYVYKDFPLTSIHPNAMDAALASQCANEQGAYWDYHDLLYSGGLSLERSSYESYAEQLGLDLTQFTACLDEGRYTDGINADMTEASSIGLSSTPTFFINGLALVGAQPFEIFEAIIDYELANPGN
jgi:protein-disulfide isomerase